MTAMLGLYLKLNLLLAVTYVFWLATKHLAVWLRFDVNHARQLTVARLLFLAVLAMAPLSLLVDAAAPWLKPLFIDEFNIVANLDNTLARPYVVAETTVIPAVILAALLLGGLMVQLVRLTGQIHKLRNIIADSTESKCISGIHVLFSPSVSTPFSTRALGKLHVVLPYQLLDSPRNLRLAVKHELQHMRNHDLEWVILLEAASVFFFWNPAMWLWHNEFDCLQEFACDEALVQDRHVSSQAYGNCLLEVASASAGLALVASSNMVPKFSFWQNHHSQLRRRIVMLTNSSTKKHARLKTLGYTLLAGFGMTQAALVVFAAESGPDIMSLVRINPDYPAMALSGGYQGWTQVEFTITETGAVLDPVIVDNCIYGKDATIETCHPDDMFNEVTLAAVAKWRYSPQLENGKPIQREGVQTIIRYMLEDDSEAASATP